MAVVQMPFLHPYPQGYYVIYKRPEGFSKQAEKRINKVEGFESFKGAPNVKFTTRVSCLKKLEEMLEREGWPYVSFQVLTNFPRENTEVLFIPQWERGLIAFSYKKERDQDYAVPRRTDDKEIVVIVPREVK